MWITKLGYLDAKMQYAYCAVWQSRNVTKRYKYNPTQIIGAFFARASPTVCLLFCFAPSHYASCRTHGHRHVWARNFSVLPTNVWVRTARCGW